ncbi:MAG TPA: hypothetical protein DEB40_08940 [Elusimicrobia bacterium]|nr:hypothetical protein [Elusimicrobiota bacterium]HBT61853.1 hypothetical protein [Elusimicrobiota bacterium]
MINTRKARWSTAEALVASFQFRTGMSGDRMAILGTVWQKELGHLSRHLELVGFRNGFIYVKPRSAAAAQELQLSSAGMVKSLNKYFSRAWIKGIKIATR